MESRRPSEGTDGPGLPPSSLRLLVPPLRLLSAAMWQVAKQKDVMNYEKLQEFVSMVTEAIPGLLNHRQRAQLILGLRARLILELCKGSNRGFVDPQVIEPYLARLPISPSNNFRDIDVETTEKTFVALVQSLLKDPTERAYFFQEVFPVEYGPRYDAALHTLLWELLCKLEKLLPIPDLKQTAAWLGSATSVLEQCEHSSPEELKFIYQHHKNSGLIKSSYGPSTVIGSCIMSALSIPPSQKTTISIGLESMHNYANILNPVAFVGADQYSVVTVYTEVEVGDSEVGEEIVESMEEVQEQVSVLEPDTPSVGVDDDDGRGGEETEPLNVKVEDSDEAIDIAKALDTLTKTFALTKEARDQDLSTLKMADPISADGEGTTADARAQEDMQAGNSPEEVESAAEAMHAGGGEPDAHTESSTHTAHDEDHGYEEDDGEEEMANDPSNEVSASQAVHQTQQPSSPENICRSRRLHSRTPASERQAGKCKTLSKETSRQQSSHSGDGSVAPSVIAIKGMNTGESGEMTSIIFTCPKCPFHISEDSPPHIHVQTVPTEEYRTLVSAKPDGAVFTPSPCSTDEIFTSIKLFPEGNTVKVKQPEKRAGGKRKALTCETCGKTFTRTSDVRRHQLTHTGERPFRCSRCDRTFQHSWDLAKHEGKHHGAPISFPCQLCKETFLNLRSLTAHHKKAHSGESRLPQICSICSQSFATSAELQEHRKSHGVSLRYICPQCGQGFDSLLARSQHRQSHLVKRQFKCPHCDKSYSRRSDVKRHLATHTGERPYQCSQCSKRFSLRFMLVKHLKVHTGERPFQCSYCPKRFTLVSILARHERMHTGEKPFLCSQCGKGFLSQGELSKHSRSHVDDRPYSCDQCDKRFKSKKTQQEHIFSHTGARPYPCTYCGKGFTKPYALTRHNLIHTGERPFPCAYCGKTFLTQGEAQLHERIHTGERPYPCNVCELKFKSSSELARHKRCHSGTKPLKPHCEHCAKTFTSKAKLRKHMETHADMGEAPTSMDSDLHLQTE